jgi:Domain of unknown function (DUF5615)
VAALYADENFPGPVVAALRAAGHDVLTAYADGRANLGIGDPDVLARATALGRAVLTHNRTDYFRLHKAGAVHAGIIACKADLDFPALAARIHAAVMAVSDLAGQLIRVNRPSSP